MCFLQSLNCNFSCALYFWIDYLLEVNKGSLGKAITQNRRVGGEKTRVKKNKTCGSVYVHVCDHVCGCVSVTVCTGAPNPKPQTTVDQW